ncbi:MAG TPA: glycosyltransferase [Rhodospirillales bacterium]|nr:glycosyltransferase [Rhodospirillales bacterium]
MNIAILGQKGIPAVCGGVEKHVEEVATRLVGMGHEVTVFTRKSYSETAGSEYRGVKLRCLPNIATKHLDAISYAAFATITLILNREVQIVHFHGIGPSLLIPLLRIFRPRLPVVATHHSRDYFHGQWGVVARSFLRLGEYCQARFASRLISVSKDNTEFLSKSYHREVTYIPNGAIINQEEDKQEVFDQYEKDDYILIVARLVPVKCIHHAIKAYQKLNTTKKLIIAGDSSYTGEYVDSLMKLGSQSEGVNFIGYQTPEALSYLYQNACFFILASETEGTSIALLEAMSYGCAVLVSDIRANTDVIGNAGVSFKQGDVESLALKMGAMLEDESIVAKCSERSVLRVRTHFDWDDIVTKLDKVYREVAIVHGSKASADRLH